MTEYSGNQNGAGGDLMDHNGVTPGRRDNKDQWKVYVGGASLAVIILCLGMFGMVHILDQAAKGRELHSKKKPTAGLPSAEFKSSGWESPGPGWIFQKEANTPGGKLEIWKLLGEQTMIMVCLNDRVLKTYTLKKNQQVDIDSSMLAHGADLSGK